MTGPAGPRTVIGGGQPHPRDVVPRSADVAAANETWGREAVRLRIGALTFELLGLDARLAALVRRQHGGFVVGDGVAATGGLGLRPVGLEVVRSPRPAWLHLPRDEGRCEDARVGARADDSGLLVWSYFFAGHVPRGEGPGRLVLCDADEADLAQALENHLRFLVATEAVRAGGFLLHAAGLVRSGHAYLFFGPSGAGKSTAAANAPPDAVHLGDDLVLVERSRAGFRAAGVPFRGTFQGPTAASLSAPVRMACRLVQSSDVRLEETRRSVQVAEVLGELPFLLDEPSLHARAAGNVERFVEAVPVRRLHLRADESYWRVLPP